MKLFALSVAAVLTLCLSMILSLPCVLCRSGNQETNSANTSSQSPQLELHPGFDGESNLFKQGSGPCAASQRHIRTEQKRRDRINEGCACPLLNLLASRPLMSFCSAILEATKAIVQPNLACCQPSDLPASSCVGILSFNSCSENVLYNRFVALQALLPGKEKVEKAVMLTQAADYIKQLQVFHFPLKDLAEAQSNSYISLACLSTTAAAAHGPGMHMGLISSQKPL